MRSSGPKVSISHLAIFGGPVAFDEPLHVGLSNIGNRDGFLTRVQDILDGRWRTNEGPDVSECEAALSRITRAKRPGLDNLTVRTR
jgi:C4-type Zn-finger protein